MSKFKKYWLFTLISTLLVSVYPIYMGISVIHDMIVYGSVPQENFPKYIIPYTPIAISVLLAVLIMPIATKFIKKFTTLTVSVISLAVFFVSEFLFESQVFVSDKIISTLEGWQMSACYINPEWFETRTWKAVDVLIGEYSPTFKLHFYMISVVLILSIINCIYGFAKMILDGKKEKCKALTVQSVCTIVFLALCIFACFTAFFRGGEIIVSPLSAFLMGLFFIILGVTVGTYISTFLLNKKASVSIVTPSVCASLTTLAMYIGETFLLSGHLYLLGKGSFLFNSLPYIVLAPIDIIIIIASGLVTALICALINKKEKSL
ncbi:MAG: hypothetical protein Q4A12_01845 [Eubacteriales bacterium]|nr:hypothetical protein [Eubacteriales bacterium]